MIYGCEFHHRGSSDVVYQLHHADSIEDSIINTYNYDTVSVKWYMLTKNEILRQSTIKPDSIVKDKDTDKYGCKNEYYFSHGRKCVAKIYKNDDLRAEIYYSKNNNFELRREICNNKQKPSQIVYLFEGIVYKGHFYGLSTWLKCSDGSLDNIGNRFNDAYIGKWRKGNGEITDNQRYSAIDSMPVISKE